jgi:two-component system nitrogen regulation response regulator GlnG
MAPAQVIEAKDLPPEVLGGSGVGGAINSASYHPAAVALEPTPVRVELPGASLAPVSGLPVMGADGLALEAAGDEAMPLPAAALAKRASGWELGLETEALELLATGRHDVWDELTRRFESKLILTALANTRGRRIEAAQKLGIGRNTITRKIQELGLE